MAASTAAKLSVVTPVNPIAAKSAAVSAGLGVPPAAVSKIRETIEAKAASSACVSTEVLALPSITSLSREALPVESMLVTPSTAYCEAVSDTLLFEPSPSAPDSRVL